jgi:adhesin/invasin
VIVYAVDAYGNRATSYTGTVHFSSSDDTAVLPADYSFTAADNGWHVFLVTFRKRGKQSLTVTDTADGTITGTDDDIIVA